MPQPIFRPTHHDSGVALQFLNRPRPCETHGLVLDGNLAELARLTAEAERFSREHSLPVEVEFDLHLALEELFVNSLRHGECEGLAGAVEVRLALLPGAVALEYADRGAPFDPADAPAPDITAPLAERAVGGLGLHLVRQIMRNIEYHRVNGWNRLRMQRPILPEGT